MKETFDTVSIACSKLVTRSYSTSFSLGIFFLDKSLHNPIYSIYGFVRSADEIVDSFHDYPKMKLLEEFKADTFKAIEEGISLNPILNSFQQTVNKYHIDHELINAFLHSMEMDLNPVAYDVSKYQEYIRGSAEVVGLMCLKVFCKGNNSRYQELTPPAMRLGSAFQKINFLRDLKNDYQLLGRSYFPEIDLTDFNENCKAQILDDIRVDFAEGYKGITQLPRTACFGVYVAYVYYKSLLNKISKTPAKHILERRIRIPNPQKYLLFVRSYCKYRLKLI